MNKAGWRSKMSFATNRQARRTCDKNAVRFFDTFGSIQKKTSASQSKTDASKQNEKPTLNKSFYA